MKRLLPLFLLLALGCSITRAADWDPEDDTFDPAVPSVIADGATRIGDPAPYYFNDLAARGFTYVGTTPDTGQGAIVSLSLISGVNGSTEGAASLFATPEQAVQVRDGLREGAEKAGEGAGETKITDLFQGPLGGTWSVWVAPVDGATWVQLRREKDGQTDLWRFSANAAKKFAGAIDHGLKKLEE